MLAGCGSATEPRGGNDSVTRIFKRGFNGPIIDSAGARIGTVNGRPDRQGLIVAYAVSTLSAGRHALHLHVVGRCDPPRFATVGGHWNASGRRHGTDNPQGPHDGDWDNLDIGSDGRGSTERLIPRWHGKIPEEGLAMIIHARPDDGITDPDGKSGMPVACAVIIPPA